MLNETTTAEEKKQTKKLDPLFLIGLGFSIIGFTYSIIKFWKL